MYDFSVLDETSPLYKDANRITFLFSGMFHTGSSMVCELCTRNECTKCDNVIMFSILEMNVSFSQKNSYFALFF